MGTKAALTVEQYLHTSFPDLDKEYRDGELVERSMPDNLHSITQTLFCEFFGALRKKFSMYPRVELRLRIGPRMVLIPDVCVFHPEPPKERHPKTPPFIAIEILSPDDRQDEVREKLEQYRLWGVPYVWLADPNSRRLYECSPSLTEVSRLRMPELGVEITPSDVFDE